jgi:sugar phosphate isomerase/epimerase
MAPQHTAELSRRGFLRTGLAAALGLAAAPAALSAGQNQRDPFGGFAVGAQSYTFRTFGLERALDAIRDLGLRHVELFRGHVPLNSNAKQIEAVRRLCEERKITPAGFGVERFTSDHKANRRLFEFGRDLGVRYLSADPAKDSFDSLNRLVEQFKIAIAIHPHGPVAGGKRLHEWYSAEAILGAVKDRHRLLGSCLDTGHLIRAAQPPFNRKLDPAAQVRAMGARNIALHLKDHDNKRREDVIFGKGVLDVAAVLRALRAVKFSGWISIEYEANPNNPTADVRACLDVFRDAVRKLG